MSRSHRNDHDERDAMTPLSRKAGEGLREGANHARR